MAFINKDNRYIKVLEDGSYFVYSSKEAREREKEATSSSIIIKKYNELIQKLLANKKKREKNPDSWIKEYTDLTNEYMLYNNSLNNFKYNPDSLYPIMAKYYPDVADSIPDIIEAGMTIVSGDSNSIEDTYNIFKERGRFGETEDDI